MKILGLITLALCFTLGSLFVTGRLLTRRLETEPRAFAPWGPGTSFLSTRSGDVHILDVGEGGDTHLPILLGRGTVDQIRSGASGVAPVSHALSPR